MSKHFKIAIIGSGPAGMSAAARAAFYDRENRVASPSHILLEGFDKPSKTIQSYQKGKFVMAEPGFLVLRSDCRFSAGSREQILGQWVDDIEQQHIHVQYGSTVSSITGEQGSFTINIAGKEAITAENIILAIGLEGNPRQLGVPGEDAPIIQYTLDDPDAYENETIIVVGAGDSAIENALVLARKNQVYIINRREEFSRAKEGNLNAVLKAINDPDITLDCFYRTSINYLHSPADGAAKYTLSINTPEGDRELQVDRIIARLGGVPPRQFVEDCGIQFSSAAQDSSPVLDEKYQATKKGIYVIGSLAGYPLIKQAMNQGYDVVEYILGNTIKPADYPLLELQFGLMPYRKEAEDILQLFLSRIPMFAELSPLTFRELIIESNVLISLDGEAYDEAKPRAAQLAALAMAQTPSPKFGKLIKAGEYVYRAGEYSNTFFTIVEGEVEIEIPDRPDLQIILKRGEFFGETSLLTGRPRLGSVRAMRDCILVETPRRTMLKLMNSNASVKQGIDWIFIVRALQKHFAPSMQPGKLRSLANKVKLQTFKAGSTLYTEQDHGDCLYLVRRGSVKLTRHIHDKEVVLSQKQADDILGEMALMGDPVRKETAIASVLTETIVVDRECFIELIKMDSGTIEKLQKMASSHAVMHTAMEASSDSGKVMGFLLAHGMGEATNALVIDESLCIGCDNCEKACADTHNGISRLDRESGATLGHVHIPMACRHCEHPYCMKDCPPDAIHRAATGEVFINDKCIGCGNCESNCPYGAIKLAYDAPPKPSLLSWMLFGSGTGPGQADAYEPTAKAKAKGKKAVKCDACLTVKGGAACVRACPTGAAARISPVQFMELIAKQ